MTESQQEAASDSPWPLVEMWAAGSVLDPATDSLDVVPVVFVLDLPAEQVPWRSRPPVADMLVSWLRVDKNPVAPLWRPRGWPAWNAEHRRVARIWTRSGGADAAVIDALHNRSSTVGFKPDAGAFTDQMRIELEVTRRHLDGSLDGFYDRTWRSKHRNAPFDLYPGDYLWWAAYGYREIERALDAAAPQ